MKQTLLSTIFAAVVSAASAAHGWEAGNVVIFVTDEPKPQVGCTLAEDTRAFLRNRVAKGAHGPEYADKIVDQAYAEYDAWQQRTNVWRRTTSSGQGWRD
jgi:hypothetical protein